jgi:hypothetical protein
MGSRIWRAATYRFRALVATEPPLGVGTMFPQPWVIDPALGSVLMDDVLPHGWILILLAA